MTKRIVSCIVLASMLISLLAGVGTPAFAAPMSTSIINLKVNNLEEPLGVDNYPLEFSWNITSNVVGQAQTAYQIKMSRDKAFSSIVWDSGVVASSESVGIRYPGTPNPETDYYWRVSVTDAWGDVITSETARFSTGLASATDRSVWEGAQFIGHTEPILGANFIHTSRADINFTINEGSNFSFIFAANDLRFTDSLMNPFNSPGGENFVRVEIDASPIANNTGTQANFAIYRVGYDESDAINGDPNVYPYKWGQLPATAITADNLRSPHTISVSLSTSSVTLNFDGSGLPTTAYSEQIATNTSQIGQSITSLGRTQGRRPGATNNNVSPLFTVSATGALGGQTGGNANAYPNMCSVGFQVNNVGDKATINSLNIYERNNTNRLCFGNTTGATTQIYADVPGATVDADGVITIIGNADNAGKPQYRDPSSSSQKYVRTEFVADKQIADAKLYATAMGGYEFYINGSRIGDDLFNPGLTQYREYLNYNTYDVTGFVKQGNNAVGALVMCGFWLGHMANGNYNTWGDNPGVMAKLVITYTDGTKKTVVTNTTDWKVCNSGPVIYTDIYHGEAYNALNEKYVEGWTEYGFVDTYGKWVTPEVITSKHPATGAFTFDNVKILARRDQPVRVAYTLEATRVLSKHSANGFTYDFGTCMTGVPSITIPAGTLKEGDRVTIRAAEEIYPGGPDKLDFDGNELVYKRALATGANEYAWSELYGDAGGYHKNAAGKLLYDTNRAAFDSDYYIACAEDEFRDVVFEPRSTFQGFRYLTISIPGRTTPLPLANVRGQELSSLPVPKNYFDATTADVSAQYPGGRIAAMQNQLFKNTLQSQFGNFISIPTDCPQRNERQGWTGDIQAYSRTATYHSLQTQNFLSQWMDSVSADLSNNGAMGTTSPAYSFSRPGDSDSSIVWGGAVIQCPWQIYMQYNDVKVIEQNYEYLKRYINNTTRGYTAADAAYPLLTTVNNLSDHVGLDSPTASGNGSCLLQNCLLIYLVGAMAKMADTVGDTAYADSLRARYDIMMDSWNRLYVEPTTGMTLSMNTAGVLSTSSPVTNGYLDSQSTYAYALYLGVVSDTMVITGDGPNAGMTYKDFFAQRLAQLIANPALTGSGRGPTPNSTFAMSGGPYTASGRPYTITSGFAATPALLPAMSATGNSETAYRIFGNPEYATWLYPVSLGATTQWELWDGFDRALAWGGSSTMNSYNHFALGSAASWMYEYQMGITTGDEPGYQDFILQPIAGGNYTSLSGGFESNYGVIESSWAAKGNGAVDEATGETIQANEMTSYSCVIPANTTVTLYLPVDEAELDGFHQIPGVTYLGMEEHNGVECAKFHLLSGGYNFEVTASGLEALHGAGYVAPVQADINSPATVTVNAPVSYTVSLEYAMGAGVVTLGFTADSRYLDLPGATALGGFSILEPLTWEYIGGQMWKGTVKLYNPGFVQSNAPLDILEISGATLGLVGDTTVTLTDFEVTGDVSGFANSIPCEIRKAEAATSIAQAYSKYDLNHDGRIDELDLAIVVFYYLANDLEADWDVVKFDIASAKDCDVAVNGRVDLADMIEVIANYADSY
ncbi:MAG: glycoside hydrolase family 78 protein [Oscillospiraceae bacterium]|nr:glycoside hydrolase family 78 protein [Oscillospiraceae bacterium]